MSKNQNELSVVLNSQCVISDGMRVAKAKFWFIYSQQMPIVEKKNQISGFVPLMVLANAKLIFITIFSTFRNDFKEEDAFVSFNDDTCASIVIQLLQTGHYDHKQVSKTFKKMKNSYVKPHGMNQYHCTLALKWLWINAFVLS